MVATTAVYNLAAPYTVSQLQALIATMFTAMSYGGTNLTNVDPNYSVTSGSSGYTYPFQSGQGAIGNTFKCVFNSGATKGSVYFNTISVLYANAASVVTEFAIFDGWNSTTHVGTNGSPYVNQSPTVTFSPNYPLSFWAINGTELKGCYFQQFGSTYNNWFMGFFRPSVEDTWWSDNTYLYCFIPYATTGYFNLLSTNWAWCNYASNAPWGVAPANTQASSPLFQLCGIGGVSSFQYPDPNNSNEFAIQTSLNFGQPTGGNCAGLVGQTTEVGSAPAFNGNSAYSGYSIQQGSVIATPTGNQYTILMPTNPGNTSPYTSIIRTA